MVNRAVVLFVLAWFVSLLTFIHARKMSCIHVGILKYQSVHIIQTIIH